MMLSVVIATENAERNLVPTLAALVPGAMAGVVREVIVADAGSSDATAEIADSAGCRIDVLQAPLIEALGFIAASLGARPGPQQGLLISKMLYERSGGHLGDDADPETSLLRRLGRRRIVVLRSRALTAG